jgi:prefoldin subunit 5
MEDYFAEQEKAKAEARRTEKIRTYQNQIFLLNNQMDDLNMEILKLQKEIERLQNYEADRGWDFKTNTKSVSKNYKESKISYLLA